jgi:hypothetical protein
MGKDIKINREYRNRMDWTGLDCVDTAAGRTRE